MKRSKLPGTVPLNLLAMSARSLNVAAIRLLDEYARNTDEPDPSIVEAADLLQCAEHMLATYRRLGAP